MRAVVQRVKSARVTVSGEIVGEIGPGLVTLLGVGSADEAADVDWLVRKIVKLRIFEDGAGKMNLALAEVGGAHLIVSQFTLYGDCAKGNRPSFISAAPPERARELYDQALETSRAEGVVTAGGRFQAHMELALVNDGPVTLMLESARE